MARKKKPIGRPPKPMPERIDASPEEIADALLRLPKDHEWEYLKKDKECEGERHDTGV